jgi:hypothetical protein
VLLLALGVLAEKGAAAVVAGGAARLDRVVQQAGGGR